MKGLNAVPRISIIIPTLNEAANILSTLESIPPAPDVEILVVDGGSEDNTVELVRTCGVSVIPSLRGRARQMNAGATLAKGEMLLFLHADTRLPVGYDCHLRRILLQPGVAAGAFRLGIDSSSYSIRIIERLANWRSRRLQMPYGDQAIFLRADTFQSVGGYPEMPIMEDFELIKRLQRMGRIVTAPPKVITSARRWQALGLWRTTFINQSILMGYALGVSHERLAQWYRAHG